MFSGQAEIGPEAIWAEGGDELLHRGNDAVGGGLRWGGGRGGEGE